MIRFLIQIQNSNHNTDFKLRFQFFTFRQGSWFHISNSDFRFQNSGVRCLFWIAVQMSDSYFRFQFSLYRYQIQIPDSGSRTQISYFRFRDSDSEFRFQNSDVRWKLRIHIPESAFIFRFSIQISDSNLRSQKLFRVASTYLILPYMDFLIFLSFFKFLEILVYIILSPHRIIFNRIVFHLILSAPVGPGGAGAHTRARAMRA